MTTAALEFLRKCHVNQSPFFSDCECCRRNFTALKMVLMREQVRAQIPNSLQPTGEDVLLIFSRPETLPCADCEGLKPRFNQLLRMLYEITKDHEGFIQLMCKPEAGLYLLKGTAVLNHFFSKEQQKDIQGNRVTNCPIY